MPALLLKQIEPLISTPAFHQLLFLHTCRANLILSDFVREVYWPAYEAGQNGLSRDRATAFVLQAKQQGKTTTAWSESMIKRVSGYLVGCCVDFGMLSAPSRGSYNILPYRIEPNVGVILAHELHFAGLGDAGVILSPDWALFGMDTADVLNELKRQSLAGWMIVQSASDVTQINWRSSSMEDVIDGIARR
jgi:hypothetical protein